MPKENARQKPKLATRVSLMDTLRLIEPGTSATYNCREAGSITTAQACVRRLNARDGVKNWKVVTTDNGATYTVTRSA